MSFTFFCLLLAAISVVARAATSSIYSAADQATLLQQHNDYRTGVTPEASDMNELEWDLNLAAQAQTWSDKCLFHHPNRTKYTDYKNVGQNLYMLYGDTTGANPPAVTEPVTDWYEEERYYYYIFAACADGEICGHYTQVVWADTTHVGCGITFCPQAVNAVGYSYSNAWLVTCNYSPAGNYIGEAPYESGTACSKCSSGKYCKNKLCSNCDPSTDSECECVVSCQNGGTKSTEGCACDCPDGYYGAHCENLCQNMDPYCGANPGWPPFYCDIYSVVVDLCPLMCGEC